jgi:hypothetical protein
MAKKAVKKDLRRSWLPHAIYACSFFLLKPLQEKIQYFQTEFKILVKNSKHNL